MVYIGFLTMESLSVLLLSRETKRVHQLIKFLINGNGLTPNSHPPTPSLATVTVAVQLGIEISSKIANVLFGLDVLERGIASTP